MTQRILTWSAAGLLAWSLGSKLVEVLAHLGDKVNWMVR